MTESRYDKEVPYECTPDGGAALLEHIRSECANGNLSAFVVLCLHGDGHQSHAQWWRAATTPWREMLSMVVWQAVSFFGATVEDNVVKRLGQENTLAERPPEGEA